MKSKVTYTVDKEIKEEFAEVCARKAISMSAWIELKMKEFIETNKERSTNAK